SCDRRARAVRPAPQATLRRDAGRACRAGTDRGGPRARSARGRGSPPCRRRRAWPAGCRYGWRPSRRLVRIVVVRAAVVLAGAITKLRDAVSRAGVDDEPGRVESEKSVADRAWLWLPRGRSKILHERLLLLWSCDALCGASSG